MSKVRILTILSAGLVAMPAFAEDRIAMKCSGQEMLQIGDQPPVSAAYYHYVSIDLAAGLVCYDKCTGLETYEIADSSSNPIKIADLTSPILSRHILYDRNTGLLTDQSETVLGAIKSKSSAAAKCQVAVFRQPMPIVPVK